MLIFVRLGKVKVKEYPAGLEPPTGENTGKTCDVIKFTRSVEKCGHI